MANIKNLEMAEALSNSKYITIKSGFLGLSKTAVYNATQSPCDIIQNEYSADMGARVERLLKAPADKLATELKNLKLEKVAIGNMRLEAVLSRDRQFAAVQLFRFVDFKYQPVTDLKTYEGHDAELIAAVL